MRNSIFRAMNKTMVCDPFPCCGMTRPGVQILTPPPPDAKRTAFTTSDVAGSIFQMAQVEKGPPWLVPRLNASFPYLNNSRAASYAMHLSNIENANLTLEDSGENTVAFKYKFQDFQGETSVLAGSTPPALLETRCQQYVTTSQDMAGPLITTNLTAYLMNEYSYRWISPLFGYQFDTSGNLLRNTTLQMCMCEVILFLCFNVCS